MEPHSTLSEIIANRYGELRAIRSAGTDPYPPRFAATHTVSEARSSAAGSRILCAGRVVQLRLMGKAAFAHIQDMTGKTQVYVKKDALGEAPYEFFKKHIHVGDFVGVEGSLFVTHTGENTVAVEKLTLLSKAIRPMPEKWHGLQDTEIRFRARHLDLLANEEVRRIFTTRSKIVRAIRNTLDNEGFLEVETPTLTPSAGGAAATPFTSYHNALKMPLYLRIALELYLKRLVIGGLERVYEIGKVFRNEGIDTRHNPEFTMLEAYQAYADYDDMARLLESMVEACTETIGACEVEYNNHKVSLKAPFNRLYLPEIWKDKTGADIHEVLEGKSFHRPKLLELCKRLHVEHDENTPSAKLFDRVFDAKLLPMLIQPAFVLDYPTAVTPLAKCKPGDESLVERFEFFAGGGEIANAYTELNDPEDQLGRLSEQMRQQSAENNEEADIIDRDFIEAMESGMPPTGGIGVGIDRIVMLLSGKPSIREVVLFPTLKPDAAPKPEEPSLPETPKAA
ncbi:MAG: lysine--tRNA ligase [Elusimicrobiales bacterium]|nr:lysine--tRNA ligase [Elusimicrobiales bacterium]